MAFLPAIVALLRFRTVSHLVSLLAAPPAHLRLWAVRAAMPLFPAVIAFLGLGAVVFDVSLLAAPPAHLRLWAVRGHVAFLTAVPALVVPSPSCWTLSEVCPSC